jgi:phage shock protein E
VTTARRTLTALTLALAVAAAGCAGTTADAPTAGDVATDESAADDPTAVIAPEVVAERHGEWTFIDVRTPAEVADGYVEGSLLLDIQDPGFDEALDALPRDEAYVVYCRTGNRSGQAIERMLELGFTEVINGGAYVDLAEHGLPTTG